MAERKLVVRTERLPELTTDDLRRIGGANIPPTLKLGECRTVVFGCTTAMTCPREEV